MLQKDLHRDGSRSEYAGRSRQDARAQLAGQGGRLDPDPYVLGRTGRGTGKGALGIVVRGDRIEKVAPDRHTVRSQTDESTTYSVVRRRSSWSCDCPDHRFGNAQCKHILAVMSLVEAKAEAQNGHAGGSEAVALEEALAEAWRTPVPAGKGETTAVSPVDGTPHRCERCNSKEIEPHEWRYNESEPVQRYRCRACGKRFVFRLGFERMRSPAWAIVDALDLYFKRLSLFEAADFLKRKGISVHPTTVGRDTIRIHVVA